MLGVWWDSGDFEVGVMVTSQAGLRLVQYGSIFPLMAASVDIASVASLLFWVEL